MSDEPRSEVSQRLDVIPLRQPGPNPPRPVETAAPDAWDAFDELEPFDSSAVDDEKTTAPHGDEWRRLNDLDLATIRDGSRAARRATARRSAADVP